MMHKRQYSDNVSSHMKIPKACSTCGCSCDGIREPICPLDLHQRIEELSSQVLRGQAHISNMELEFENRIRAANFDVLDLRKELVKLRDRYERLMESHKRMQKINDNLENKLLNVVNSTESEKTSLQKEVAAMTSKLVDAKFVVCDLEEENERYRNDCNLAVQLLQCKPSNFVAQKLDALPYSLQERVKPHMTSEQVINMENSSAETKLIHVPMQTFPPTAMVYSVPKHDKNMTNGNSDHNVPMSLIAKVLTQPASKRKPQRTYICIKCKEDYNFSHQQTQTNVVKEVERGMKPPLKVHRKLRNQSSSSSTETDI